MDASNGMDVSNSRISSQQECQGASTTRGLALVQTIRDVSNSRDASSSKGTVQKSSHSRDARESANKSRESIKILGTPARSRIPTKVEVPAELGKSTTKETPVRAGTIASAGNSERVR
jgi:hypothetical protein